MSDFTGIIVVLLAMACMFLGQRKHTPKVVRRQYSLVGIIASVLVAVEAMHRGEPGVAGLFMLAAGSSLIGLVLDMLKPSNPNS